MNTITFGASSFIAGAAKGAIDAVGPFILGFCLTLIFAGISLAYYLPSVPFILWAMGVIGWIIICLETLVAAPLWSAGHAIPEGEGLAGQYGRQGYMLFIGILMRPALMVAGFFMAFLVMKFVGTFIGHGYEIMVAGMNGATATNSAGGVVATVGRMLTPPAWIIAILATAIIGGGICIVAAHKVFGLITWLPENVMKWIGGSTGSLGEGQDSHQVRNSLAAAVGLFQSNARPGGLGSLPKKSGAGVPGAGDHAMGEKGGEAHTPGSQWASALSQSSAQMPGRPGGSDAAKRAGEVGGDGQAHVMGEVAAKGTDGEI